MEYDQIMTLVDASLPEDWAVLDSYTESHHSDIYVYRPDVTITLAWGAPIRENNGWDHEPWSAAFPDHMVYGYYYDVRYNGSPIFRDVLLSVDGGRALLPAGKAIGEQGVGVTGHAVNLPQVTRARLINQLTTGGDEFDSYLTRANITVV